jgi:cytochrome c oxidase subunit 3
MSSKGGYYLPDPSHWPIVGSIGIFLTLGGFAMALPQHTADGSMGNLTVMWIGVAVLAFMMFGWFGTVIRESEKGLYDAQVDKSFRWGMIWFIFSEVMFFAAFFGALYYVRQFALPWLDGAGNNAMTGQLLWPDFSADWPLMSNPNPETYAGQKEIIPAWGVPAINTAILLTSGVTITIAHHMLKAGKRGALVFWMAATVALGIAFLYLQAHEYSVAYNELGLTLGSGIYGSTFFMLTGFHGAHVTIGTIMLIVITLRCAKGHFKPDNHFGFEAVAWYWHFVDVVWLGLFIFVYWL